MVDELKATGTVQVPTSSALADENAANNKLLLKFYGIGFGVVVSIILVLLVFRNSGGGGELVSQESVMSPVGADAEVLQLTQIELSAEDEPLNEPEVINNQILDLQAQVQALSEIILSQEIADRSTSTEQDVDGVNELIQSLNDANTRILTLETELQVSAQENTELRQEVSELRGQITDLASRESELATRYEDETSAQATLLAAQAARIGELDQEVEQLLLQIEEMDVLLNPEVTDYTPLYAVAPEYPERAAQRGLEGWALVDFTVGSNGAVIEGTIRVIDAEPSNIFNRSAIRAASQFEFQPRTENGVPVDVPNVQYLFRFQLED